MVEYRRPPYLLLTITLLMSIGVLLTVEIPHVEGTASVMDIIQIQFKLMWQVMTLGTGQMLYALAWMPIVFAWHRRMTEELI